MSCNREIIAALLRIYATTKMKIIKSKKADAKSVPLEEIVIWTIAIALIIWALLWYSGLGKKAIELITEFF